MVVCDKFIIQVTKVLLEVLEMHPFCYVELIPTSLEFSVFYCFTETGQSLAFERFTIQSLNLMKYILLAKDYRPAKVLEGMFKLLIKLKNIFNISFYFFFCKKQFYYRNNY